MKPVLLTLAALLLPIAVGVAQTDQEIREILVDRIEIARQSVGMVVGVINQKGRRIVALGSLDQNDNRPVNGDTVFEIGSITKVFTSLVLSDMVQRGELALADPIGKYLPEDVKVPERGGKVITLQDLSTHFSGLPRLPGNLAPKNPSDPYAEYSVDNLYQFLSGYTLPRDPGEKWEYSNLGTGLLGHVLSLRAGSSYGAVVRSRITGPLHMNDTGIRLSPTMKTRLAVGHNAKLAAVPNWNFQALAGAGALYSTANDMLTFLAADFGYVESRLAPAMAAMLKIRKPTSVLRLESALGWQINAGGVVLSNTFTMAGVSDIGLHILDPAFPLIKIEPPKEHKEISVDLKVLDIYVGRYQLAPNFILTVTKEGNHLGVQATNQGRFEIFPESDRTFFAKISDIQITFETGALVLRQNGVETRAARIP